MSTRAQATTTAIFRAVTDLILQGGIAAVTLSAVCRQAGISKGGLVHYFPSKESMVEAFVNHSCEECLACLCAGLSSVLAGAGRRTRAFVDLMLAEPAMCNAESSRELAAVMIALMQGAGVGSHFYDTIYRELGDDGVPHSLIDLVVAAIDGLWLQSAVLPTDVVQARAERLRQQLHQIIAQSIPECVSSEQTTETA